MESNFYSYKDIVKSLKKLDVKEGDNLFIHSNIGLFGFLKEAKNENDYYQLFKQAIFEVIGDNGTMVNPTFSYTFCKGEDYNPAETPSDCGVLSNLALKDQDAIRSDDANFSITAVGKNAEYFTANPTKYSFGEGSFWERFLKEKGKFLFFNLYWAFPTFNHYVERHIKVPYRYDKPFKGKVIKDGKATDKVFYHYVNDLKKNNKVDVKKFTDKAYEKGYVKSVDLCRGQMSIISSTEAVKLIMDEIKIDPSFLVDNIKVDFEMKSILNEYFDRLWPITRSLTGNGNRETLKILSEIIDLEVKEVPSGTQCFDWTVPPEWNIKEAWIKNSNGETIVDFSKNNLHILGYSEPFQGNLSFEELRSHLHTLPDQPELIPYLTSYYKRSWGFCISYNQLQELDKNDAFEIFIDSTIEENGSMTIGEAIIKGRTEKEVLFSTYICHPSLASNELSGPLVSAFIYNKLKEQKDLKYTYRFLFIPETIGSIYSLSVKGEHWKKNLTAGFIITCIGDDGKFTYKRSRIGNSLPDRAAEIILKQTEKDFNVHDFSPYGSDERQYCSPGFNLPVGSLMRTMYYKYPEYHTSADNKDLISFEAMEKSICKYLEIIEVLERNEKYINTMPFCEPQLGKRGLYPTLGSQKDTEQIVKAMMWILNLSDGTNDLIAISGKSNIPIQDLIPEVEKLIEHGLLKYEDN